MYDKAMSLFEEAWDGRKHKLGDKHPGALVMIETWDTTAEVWDRLLLHNGRSDGLRLRTCEQVMAFDCSQSGSVSGLFTSANHSALSRTLSTSKMLPFSRAVKRQNSSKATSFRSWKTPWFPGDIFRNTKQKSLLAMVSTVIMVKSSPQSTNKIRWKESYNGKKETCQRLMVKERG